MRLGAKATNPLLFLMALQGRGSYRGRTRSDITGLPSRRPAPGGSQRPPDGAVPSGRAAARPREPLGLLQASASLPPWERNAAAGGSWSPARGLSRRGCYTRPGALGGRLLPAAASRGRRRFPPSLRGSAPSCGLGACRGTEQLQGRPPPRGSEPPCARPEP